MTEAITTQTSLTIGIDLGDRKSHVCVLDAAWEVVEERRISTTPRQHHIRGAPRRGVPAGPQLDPPRRTRTVRHFKQPFVVSLSNHKEQEANS